MNILLIIVSVVLNCIAQILMKKGMMMIGEISLYNLKALIVPMICNIYLWGAMFAYAFSIILWLIVLSKEEVSFAYPFLSIGYVIAAIIGWQFLGETLSLTKIAGIVVICVGVIIISKG